MYSYFFETAKPILKRLQTNDGYFCVFCVCTALSYGAALHVLVGATHVCRKRRLVWLAANRKASREVWPFSKQAAVSQTENTHNDEHTYAHKHRHVESMQTFEFKRIHALYMHMHTDELLVSNAHMFEHFYSCPSNSYFTFFLCFGVLCCSLEQQVDRLTERLALVYTRIIYTNQIPHVWCWHHLSHQLQPYFICVRCVT